MAAHQLLFALAIGFVSAAALRLSAHTVGGLAIRVLAAAPIGLAFVVVESLVFGLVGWGGSAVALSVGSVVFWLVVRLLVGAPETTIRAQARAWWSAASLLQRAAAGAASAVVVGEAAVQFWRPLIGGDGITYHAAQPVIWIQNGHPGSLHQTLADFPTQAYPRTLEVLISWAYAIGRTPLAGTVFTLGITVLCVASLVILLREVGAGWVLTIGGAAGGLLLPLNMIELSGVYSDLPALGLLACTGALCAMARREPGVLGPALLAAGLAIGIKPTALPLAVAGLVWAGSAQWARIRSGWRPLAVPGAVALGLAGIWYVADWVNFGSPLWPFSRFPSGQPIPLIWREYGERFLSDPRTTIDAAGTGVYVHWLAGGLIMMAGAIVVALLALTPLAVARRRAVVFGLVALLVEVFLWSDSEFTGIAHGNVTFVVTGLRYLTPAPIIAVLVLAVASQSRPVIRRICELVVIAATALDVWELRAKTLGYPDRPAIAVLVALALVGALVAAQLGSRQRVVALLTTPVAALVGLAGFGVVLAVTASSYLDHYLDAARLHEYADAPVLNFLKTQPAWINGSVPVASGPAAYASFAGPNFTHRISLVGQDASCAEVRADARRGWLVLRPFPDEPFQQLDYLAPLRCMAGVRPAAIVAGRVRIYAPGS